MKEKWRLERVGRMQVKHHTVKQKERTWPRKHRMKWKTKEKKRKKGNVWLMQVGIMDLKS
eukprot:11246041-Ditylum_brightwellii.AAC.1